MSRSYGWLIILALASRTALADATDAAAAEQELPKVLYVVPWKEIEVERAMPPAQAGQGDVLPAPLEREAVRRQLRRREAVQPEQQGTQGAHPG